MQRIAPIVLAVITVAVLPVVSPARAEVVIADFDSNPLVPHGNNPVFLLRGPGASQFSYDASSRSRFPGDPRGSLVVTYDSLEPTTRLYTTFAGGYSQQDDFVFGAVLTIRPDGFAPDPSGFHPITFELFNAATTGDDRTGDLSDFRADTFDTLELAWFPNVSPFFGGPFLSPGAFGGAVSQDAFDRFAFATVQLALEPGVTYLVEMRHSAADRTMSCRLFTVSAKGVTTFVPGSGLTVDLSRIGSFLVDSLGITSYLDGFNIFSDSGRSLLATVEYDLLYTAPVEDGQLPGSLARALRKLGRGRDAGTAIVGR